MQWHYLILALRTIMQSDLCSRGQEAMHNFQAFLKSRLCFEIKLTTSFGMRQRPRTGISKLFHQEKRGKNISPSNRLVLCSIWFDFIRRTGKKYHNRVVLWFQCEEGVKVLFNLGFLQHSLVWFLESVEFQIQMFDACCSVRLMSNQPIYPKSSSKPWGAPRHLT